MAGTNGSQRVGGLNPPVEGCLDLVKLGSNVVL